MAQDTNEGATNLPEERGGQAVDASGASGVQVGDYNSQVNYFYGAVSWSDRVNAPPLVTTSGYLESPYRGLNAFDERDAPFYFGRDHAVSELLRRVGTNGGSQRLVVVSGVSGSGKSSLLRAGLVPRLRPPESGSGAGWLIMYITPSQSPLDALAVGVANLAGLDAVSVRRELAADPTSVRLVLRQALQRGAVGTSHDRVLLLVDQFEQIFTLGADESERSTVIQALGAASSPGSSTDGVNAVVVIGVRADFEARCADYDELAEAVQHRFLLTSMTQRQLRTAIAEPARVAGSHVEEDLVQTLLEELRAHQAREDSSIGGRTAGAGALPLLSHSLDQAWRSRAGGSLTLADYERTGGIEAAVAASAQRTYESLTPSQRDLARSVFLQLTAVQSDGLDVVSKASRLQLIDGMTTSERNDIQVVFEAFASERLLTLDSETVEISHEAVLSAWPLLRDTWLAQTHADRLVRTRLRSAADEWDKQERDPSYLYRGTLLVTAEEALTRMSDVTRQRATPSRLEADFLAASGRAQHRRTILRRATLAAVILLVIALATSTVWASRATLEARDNLDAALAQQDLAASKTLLLQSKSTSDSDPAKAQVMSLAAWSLDNTPEALYTMEQAAVLRSGSSIAGHRDRVLSLAINPAGNLITGSADGSARTWDLRRGQQVAKAIHGEKGAFAAIAVSPDGRTLAATIPDGTVRLWRLPQGTPIGAPLKVANELLTDVAFSPDGRTLITPTYEGNWVLWDPTRPGKPKRVAVPKNLGDGPEVVSDRGRNFILGIFVSDQVVRRLKAAMKDGACENPVTLSPTGETVICVDSGKPEAKGAAEVWLVRLSAGRTRKLLGPEPEVNGRFAFSPGGNTVAALAYVTGRTTIWDVASGEIIADPINDATRSIIGIIFSADGRSLIGGTKDGTIRTWEVRPKERTETVVGRHSGGYRLSVLAPSARGTISVGWDGVVEVRTLPSGALTKRYSVPVGDTGYAAVAFSPDRKRLAVSDGAGLITLRDSATGGALGPVIKARQPVSTMSFSGDGTLLLYEDDKIRVVDIARHAEIKSQDFPHSPTRDIFADGELRTTALALDARGRLLIGTTEGTLEIVEDILTTPRAHLMHPHDSDVVIALDPHSDRMASAGTQDGTIKLWDISGPAQEGRTHPGSPDGTTALTFSPDGRTLAEGRKGGTIQLWDVATWSPIGAPLTGPSNEDQSNVTAADQLVENAVTSLNFSTDGTQLLSAGGDGTLRLWNTAYIMNPRNYLCHQIDATFLLQQWRKIAPAAPPISDVCGK